MATIAKSFMLGETTYFICVFSCRLIPKCFQSPVSHHLCSISYGRDEVKRKYMGLTIGLPNTDKVVHENHARTTVKKVYLLLQLKQGIKQHVGVYLFMRCVFWVVLSQKLFIVLQYFKVTEIKWCINFCSSFSPCFLQGYLFCISDFGIRGHH